MHEASSRDRYRGLCRFRDRGKTDRGVRQSVRGKTEALESEAYTESNWSDLTLAAWLAEKVITEFTLRANGFSPAHLFSKNRANPFPAAESSEVNNEKNKV